MRTSSGVERVSIGDVATYDHELEMFNGSIGTARAFDNKVGAYIVGETLIRLAKEKKKLAAKVVSVATAQEEIGVRGATTSAYLVNPHIAIAVDVGHATDHPDCDNRRFGETKLGGGPILCRGANINPKVFDRLLKAGADPNETSEEGQTALMTAALNGRVEAVKLLLQRGAKINANEPYRGQNALIMAAGEGNVKAIEMLIEFGADTRDAAIAQANALIAHYASRSNAPSHWPIACASPNRVS